MLRLGIILVSLTGVYYIPEVVPATLGGSEIGELYFDFFVAVGRFMWGGMAVVAALSLIFHQPSEVPT